MSPAEDWFSLRDYMEGKDLPSLPREESGVRPMPVVKYYGVARSAKGKAYAFVVNDVGKVPENCLEVHNCIEDFDLSKESIWVRARALVDNYEPISYIQTAPNVPLDPPIQVGAITYHVDDQGSHLALVLGLDQSICKALFFTSNPLWNRFCRAMTRDEIALAGFVTRKKITYFAPVIRSLAHFVAYEPTYSFSKDRIADLLEEFGPGLK